MSVLIISNRIGIESFGLLSLNLLGYAISSVLALAGHESILLRRLVGRKVHFFVIKNTIIAQYFSCIFLSVPFFSIFYYFINNSFGDSFLLMLFAVLLCPLQSFNQLLYSEKKFKISASIGIVVSIVVFAIRYFAPSSYIDSQTYYIFTYSLEVALFSVLYTLLTLFNSSLKSIKFFSWLSLKSFKLKIIFKYLRHSFSIWIGGLANQLLGRLDQLLVVSIMDLKAVGIVALASKFVEGAVGLIISISPIWQREIFSSVDGGSLRKNLSKVIVMGVLAAFLGYFISVSGVYLVADFFDSEDYSSVQDIIWFSALLIPGVVLGIINGAPVIHFRSQDSAAFRVIFAIILQACCILYFLPKTDLYVLGPINLVSYIASTLIFNNFYGNGKKINSALKSSILMNYTRNIVK